MIAIDPALYWEFRALQRELEIQRTAAMVTSQKLEAVSRRIEAAYPAVNFTDSYTLHDAQCALVPVVAGNGQDVGRPADPLATAADETAQKH